MSEAGLASYDLHLHTYWSYDAEADPELHFQRARELGLRCITITEHHVLDSQEELMAVAAEYSDVRTIPSAELTVTTSIGAVDLLCYGFPTDLPDSVREVLAAYHKWQRAYGAAISVGLEGLGHSFSDEIRMELLESYRPQKTIDVQGNTHVKGGVFRDYCVNNGFIDSIDDWSDLMRRANEKGNFPAYPAVADVIPTVKAAGVVVAIAHPFGYFKEDDREHMDGLREECRLDGIECAHPGVPPEFTARYRSYCEENGMFSTGGSDCHSNYDIRTKMAGHCGEDHWLDEFLERVEN